MTAELERYEARTRVEQLDPTGGRLVAWALAANAANQLAKALTRTTFVPQAFAGNENDATAAILMGDELGLSPIAALRSLYVVHGAPALYARSMVALAQSRGHEIWTELSTSEKVVVCGRRRGSDHVERAEWTMSRARQAGYTSNKKYGSNPQEMLYAKAAAEIARKVAADVLAGVPYSVEDIELEDAATTSTTTVSRDKPKTAKRQTVEVPTPDEPPLDPEPDFNEPEAPETEVVPDITAEATPRLITDAQQKKFRALLAENNITQRPKIIELVGRIIQREVESSKNLTVDEASEVIDSLQSGAWKLVMPYASDDEVSS